MTTRSFSVCFLLLAVVSINAQLDDTCTIRALNRISAFRQQVEDLVRLQGSMAAREYLIQTLHSTKSSEHARREGLMMASSSYRNLT